MGELDEVVVGELLLRKVAALADTGMKINEIAEETKLSRYQVSRIMKRDDFKELMKAMGEKYLAEAKSKWVTGVSRRIDKMLGVLDSRLEKNDLEAVRLGLATLGIGAKEQAPQGDGTIQIVLPGGAVPKDIKAESRPLTEEESEHG